MPHDKLGVPPVAHTLCAVPKRILAVQISVLEKSVTKANEASLELVVVHLALDRLGPVVDLMIDAGRQSRDDCLGVAHQRNQPGLMVAEQVMLWAQRGDERQTVVKVSFGIYGGVVTVVSDSATTQTGHVDGIAKMQHRVRLPAITEAEDLLEYSLVGHEAVAA